MKRAAHWSFVSYQHQNIIGPLFHQVGDNQGYEKKCICIQLSLYWYGLNSSDGSYIFLQSSQNKLAHCFIVITVCYLSWVFQFYTSLDWHRSLQTL